MTLPTLYLEGLMQRSVLGSAELNAYKLGLIEALLKDTLRRVGAIDDGDELQATLRTAIEVARWEPPGPPRHRPERHEGR
ncbi:MAG: hypothetical protein KY438_03455 [Actinobacteria bacterium]|nr:hypothetical protein [Actinomycetota bacterium]